MTFIILGEPKLRKYTKDYNLRYIISSKYSDGDFDGSPVGSSTQFNFKDKLKISFEVYYTTNIRFDLDNLIKRYLDTFNGIIYKDDSQVVEIRAKKVKTKRAPFTKIIIHKAKAKNFNHSI